MTAPHRVAFVYAPDPAVAGGGTDIRVRELAAAIGAVYSTVVTSAARPATGATRRTLMRVGAVGHQVPPRLSQSIGRADGDSVAASVAGADIVVASTIFSVPLIPAEALNRTILDAHNLEWKVVEQLAAVSPTRGRRIAYAATTRWTQSFESKIARTVAGVWAVSDEEATWFRQAGAHKVWTIPNGVRIPTAHNPLPDSPTILFVGSLGSVFNRDAVSWFLSSCWPLIRSAIPNAEFTIVGASDRATTGPGVRSVGFVPNVGEFYERARVVVVPIQSGAGTRLKVLEAMAHGRPVVSTSVGAEGLGLTPGKHVEIADAADGFAQATIRLLVDRDEAAALGESGRVEATRRFSWTRVGEAAVDSVGQLLG